MDTEDSVICSPAVPVKNSKKDARATMRRAPAGDHVSTEIAVGQPLLQP
jgi:hypothetical protein